MTAVGGKRDCLRLPDRRSKDARSTLQIGVQEVTCKEFFESRHFFLWRGSRRKVDANADRTKAVESDRNGVGWMVAGPAWHGLDALPPPYRRFEAPSFLFSVRSFGCSKARTASLVSPTRHGRDWLPKPHCRPCYFGSCRRFSGLCSSPAPAVQITSL